MGKWCGSGKESTVFQAVFCFWPPPFSVIFSETSTFENLNDQKVQKQKKNRKQDGELDENKGKKLFINGKNV